MKNLVFIDVDGTLVNYEGQVPPGVAEIIKKSREKGNKILFCTGRSKAEIYPELWEIGFDGMVGGNGSYIEFENEEVYHKTLSKEQCEEIVNWLYGNNLEFYIESNGGLFASKNFETVGEPAIEKYSRNLVDGSTLTVRQAFPEMIFGGDVIRDDVNKISFVLNSYDDFLKAVERFPDLQVGTWGGAGNKALFGDIALKGINKGKAITKLVEHLNANPLKTYAFGDGDVDIPMFEAANTGIAMGNSSLEVKQHADFVTDDVDENGLINAFKALGLS